MLARESTCSPVFHLPTIGSGASRRSMPTKTSSIRSGRPISLRGDRDGPCLVDTASHTTATTSKLR
ncbi:MAG: hypothetical protein ACLR8Y_08080 [Alistipes indistinctus]